MSEFVPFRFKVSLLDSGSGNILCRGYFSEVSGLEMTMEPKAISEGGRNWGELQRVGLTRFSPIVLKRGVTDSTDLWSWFDAVTRGGAYGYRLDGSIAVMGAEVDEQGEAKVILTWNLSGVLPTRFKAADLSATASQVAIEEITLVHESLTLAAPESASPAGDFNSPATDTALA
ncbi:MAG TPA: phage tail protein [Cellvibrio sp.]|nr:phage tail protein [Cellvibrio sp.]